MDRGRALQEVATRTHFGVGKVMKVVGRGEGQFGRNKGVSHVKATLKTPFRAANMVLIFDGPHHIACLVAASEIGSTSLGRWTESSAASGRRPIEGGGTARLIVLHAYGRQQSPLKLLLDAVHHTFSRRLNILERGEDLSQTRGGGVGVGSERQHNSGLSLDPTLESNPPKARKDSRSSSW